MKGALLAIAASALLGCVAAGDVHERRYAHQALHHLKRNTPAPADNATCGCVTIYTTVYGEATLVQPAAPSTTAVSLTTTSYSSSTAAAAAESSTTPTPSSSAAPATTPSSSYTPPPPPPSSTSTYVAPPPSSTSTYVAPPATSTAAAAPQSSPSSTYIAPPPTSTAAAAPQSSPSPPPSSSNTGSSAPITGGNHWAITYSPFTNSGTCKDASSIASDISAIATKGFSTIRLYSTDCKGLPIIGPAARSHNLKLILGIFISASGIPAAAGQVHDITSHFAGDYSIVEMVVVGNEALFNGYASAPALANFISETKNTLRSAGCNAPFTTTEPISILAANAATLCSALDVVAANIHPFFNAHVSADSAGDFVARSLADLAKVCPGKSEAFNLETGWPHQGSVNGMAVPGKEEQQKAIESIREKAGGKSTFFSFVDDLWKAEGEFGVERSWGCSHLFE